MGAVSSLFVLYKLPGCLPWTNLFSISSFLIKTELKKPPRSSLQAVETLPTRQLGGVGRAKGGFQIPVPLPGTTGHRTENHRERDSAVRQEAW